jgi:hypothetical protein
MLCVRLITYLFSWCVCRCDRKCGLEKNPGLVVAFAVLQTQNSWETDMLDNLQYFTCLPLCLCAGNSVSSVLM